MPRYSEIDSGMTEGGNPWRVGLIRGRLVVMWGRLTMTPADQDAFAEAVARACTPSLPPTPRAAMCPRCYLLDGAPPVPGSAAERCDHIWHRYRPQAEAVARATAAGAAG